MRKKVVKVVSLFVRLWVEMAETLLLPLWESRQPLREAVSWNAEAIEELKDLDVSLFVRLWVEINWKNRVCKDTGRSASSWGCELKWFMGRIPQFGSRSASSWGCELKYYENYTGSIAGAVSLFVRLWVEIKLFLRHILLLTVSLFVRLWVEMCEVLPLAHSCKRQPLREAVSWNTPNSSIPTLAPPSASSWGCELKLLHQYPQFTALSVSLFVRLWVEILSVLDPVVV